MAWGAPDRSQLCPTLYMGFLSGDNTHMCGDEGTWVWRPLGHQPASLRGFYHQGDGNPPGVSPRAPGRVIIDVTVDRFPLRVSGHPAMVAWPVSSVTLGLHCYMDL